MALPPNLLLIYEARLEREHGVSNAAEHQRRQERQRELKQAARQAESPLTTLRTGLRRATQRSVKFIRWRAGHCAKISRKKPQCPAWPSSMPIRSQCGPQAIRHFSSPGVSIGSGVIEAGCKAVPGSRCKQSGMFWDETGAENILAFRCIHAAVD